jgi:hypothetical protein
MVHHLDPRYRPIVYDIAMSAEQIQQWAADGVPPGGTRTRAAQAGRRGGQVSSQVSRGDNLSPLAEDESQQVSRGDNVPPLETQRRGDNSGGSGVTNPAFRGDSGVTRTVHEPSTEPSSSSPPSAAAPAAPAAQRGGGMNDQPPPAAFDLLPGNRPQPPQRHPRCDRETDPGPRRLRLAQSRNPQTADRRRNRRPARCSRTNPARLAGHPEPTLAHTSASPLVWTMRSTHPLTRRSAPRRTTLPLPRVSPADHRTSGPTTLRHPTRPRPPSRPMSATAQCCRVACLKSASPVPGSAH